MCGFVCVCGGGDVARRDKERDTRAH